MYGGRKFSFQCLVVQSRRPFPLLQRPRRAEISLATFFFLLLRWGSNEQPRSGKGADHQRYLSPLFPARRENMPDWDGISITIGVCLCIAAGRKRCRMVHRAL